MIKILPYLNLTNGIIVWIVFIVFIKIVNVTCSYINYKEIILPHTIANKITGLILFIAPFIIVNANPIIFESILCGIATFAAGLEGKYLKTRKYTLERKI